MFRRLVKTAWLLALSCSVSGVGRGADWVSLFNGRDLSGWRQINGTATYVVEDGAILGTTAEGSPNSFLCTEKLYRDFELEFEVKVDPRLNSGVQIRSNSFPEYRDGRVHGYQVEISVNGDAGFIYDEARRGWLSLNRSNPAARRAFQPEEWNRYRVVCLGDSIRTWINGVPVADVTDSLTLKGFIGLQVHSFRGDSPAQVRWRNIRLRELNDYGWTSLFNGSSLKGWYTFLSRVIEPRSVIGKNTDPDRIFQVRDGAIHIYPDQAAGSPVPFGYLSTEKEYSHYQLRLQYKWGEKRFAPRQEAKKDSGLLYHFVGNDRVWPVSVECQIQEGDTGDVFTVYTTVEATVDPKLRQTELRFLEGSQGGAGAVAGAPDKIARVVKSATHEKEGWNTVEVIIRGEKAVHIVNDEVNNRVSGMRFADPTEPRRMLALTKGKILLQAEGAEVLFRDIQIRELPLAPPSR